VGTHRVLRDPLKRTMSQAVFFAIRCKNYLT
jgi:hypothetical protein